MPFRERVKRVFRRSDSQSDGSSLKETKSRKSSSNIYQPGEPMPKPKYRQPVDKQHKEKLESFTFADNWKRRSMQSIQSLYSPMGSRLPSRNNSLSHHRPKFTRGQSAVGKVVENAADTDDVTNVGGSRKQSTEEGRLDGIHSTDNMDKEQREAARIAKYAEDHAKEQEDSARSAPIPNGNAIDHRPFSEQDVQAALQRSTSNANSGAAH